MSTIAATVYDAIAALPGCGCSMREVVEALPDVDRKSVLSAVHRMSEKGVLRLHRAFGVGAFYTITLGATRPIDGRGRPRKREQSHDSCSFKPMGDAP
ncbi:MAG TPA: hypothetical protein VGT81_10060 [Casimicrobiaceae bacterium]|nr:hypothetical protein [Casimicrobiaceae bacterium]